MLRRTLFVAAFVAAATFVFMGGSAHAAKKQAVQQSPCAWMLDIDKNIGDITGNSGSGVACFDFVDCVLCRCVLKGVEQDVFRIRYNVDATSSDCMTDGDCDDSNGQITDVHVQAIRWVVVELDPAKQNNCIRGKEDVKMQLTNGETTIFTGSGVGVVGVGDPLSGQLCCNFDENEATIHLRGLGHDDFGGPAPKKRCWARVKFISRINPNPTDDPCSIADDPNPAFVVNGVEGCICDSFFNVGPTPP